MNEILFHAHSGLRYLVLLAGVLALAYAAFGFATKRPFDRTGRILAASFTGLVDLQVLLGLILLFLWPFYGALIGHITMMVLAAATAHATGIANRRRPEAVRSFGILAGGVALALLFIIAGIMAISRPIL